MDLNHYVIQDVSSVDTANQKLLYTHHTDMETRLQITHHWTFYCEDRNYDGKMALLKIRKF